MSVFDSIWRDIRYTFRMGNMVNKLALINFITFVVVNLLLLVLWLGNQGNGVPNIFTDIIHFISMPAEWLTALKHPWGIITSMFLHVDVFHILGNIIFLMLFGNIVGDLIGDSRVFPIYLVGGLVANILFLVSDFWIDYPVPFALGASGAVMALAGAVLILAPDYRVRLLLLGEVKVKYIVLVMVLLDLVSIARDSNTGGHIAHIGGFITGCFFVYNLRDGKDLALSINRWVNAFLGLFSGKKRLTVQSRKKSPFMKATVGGAAKGTQSSDTHSLSHQEKLDAILDKIKQQGYEGLSQEEKDFLYEASKK